MPVWGYPDWQKGSTGFAYNTINNISHWTILSQALGTFYAGNFPYLRIDFENDDGLAQDIVTVIWSDDQVGLIPGGRNVVSFGPGDRGGTTIPVQAPFVSISVNANINATASTRLLVYGTTSDGRGAVASNGAQYEMMFDEPTLGANANTAVFGANFWYTGWAQAYMIGSAGGPCFTILTYFDTSHTAVEFMKLGGQAQSGSISQMVYMPPYPCFFQLFNGATAQVCEFCLSPAPR